MKKFFISWTLPFLIAFILVFVIRIYFIQILIVDNDDMKNTLQKGEKIVCLKVNHFDRNSIVSLKLLNTADNSLKRLVALSMDTLIVKASNLFVNRVKVAGNNSFSFVYSFTTDSIAYASKLLTENKFEFNPILATLGIFQFNASIEDLKKVKSDSIHFEVKRLVYDPAVSIAKDVFFHHSFYWNRDNFGPFIVPGKGAKVQINKKLYFIYKQIIELETGKKLEFHDNIAYLANTPIKTYTFRKNYYFLLNDNWDHTNDSRTLGFVAEENIESRYWFKLVW